jgi:hypothetical protein
MPLCSGRASRLAAFLRNPPESTQPVRLWGLKPPHPAVRTMTGEPACPVDRTPPSASRRHSPCF